MLEGMLSIIGIGIAFGLYCCLIVGKRADQTMKKFMEENKDSGCRKDEEK